MRLPRSPFSIFFASLAALLTVSGMSAHAQPSSNTPSHPRAVFLPEARIAELRRAVEADAEPTFSAFQALKEEANANLDREPTTPKHWYVPGFYDDAEGHQRAKNGLRDDANASYSLALAYRVTDEPQYREAALRLINSWASGVESMSLKDDSTLSFSYHFPSMIFAADLLRQENEAWPEESQEAFAIFLREKALPMNTMDRANNWGNWGAVLVAACAAYLDDEDLLEETAERWKHFIEHQIAEDGHLPHEVVRGEGRRGIWYSHFCIMPQTIAAEILKVNGTDLYAYEAPNGRTLESAFAIVARWTEKPETFPFWEGDPARLLGVDAFSYFEVLNPLWPQPAATRMLKASRPVTASHAAPHLTFTHGQPLKD